MLYSFIYTILLSVTEQYGDCQLERTARNCVFPLLTRCVPQAEHFLFFINQDKNAGRLPDSPRKNVHVHVSTLAWMSIFVERCQADVGLQTETMTREPLALQMRHLWAKWLFWFPNYWILRYGLLFGSTVCSITIYRSDRTFIGICTKQNKKQLCHCLKFSWHLEKSCRWLKY